MKHYDEVHNEIRQIESELQAIEKFKDPEKLEEAVKSEYLQASARVHDPYTWVSSHFRLHSCALSPESIQETRQYLVNRKHQLESVREEIKESIRKAYPNYVFPDEE